MHYYKSGHKDEMHCHNADQTFYVIDGECTMRFPDGGKAVLKPGQIQIISYETRKDIREPVQTG
jgi:quercetin dioxygenase-like cupin family protein